MKKSLNDKLSKLDESTLKTVSDALNKFKIYSRHCKSCKKQFETVNENELFCSQKCIDNNKITTEKLIQEFKNSELFNKTRKEIFEHDRKIKSFITKTGREYLKLVKENNKSRRNYNEALEKINLPSNIKESYELGKCVFPEYNYLLRIFEMLEKEGWKYLD